MVVCCGGSGSGKLPLLTTRPVVTFPATGHHCLVTEVSAQGKGKRGFV